MAHTFATAHDAWIGVLCRALRVVFNLGYEKTSLHIYWAIDGLGTWATGMGAANTAVYPIPLERIVLQPRLRRQHARYTIEYLV